MAFGNVSENEIANITIIKHTAIHEFPKSKLRRFRDSEI